MIELQTTIAAFDLAFNTILMSLYFIIAFLYFQGLKYAKEEGKLIIQAVMLIFFIAGVRYVSLVMINIISFSNGTIPEVGSDATLYIFRALSAAALIAGAMYFLYATLKKNPPTDTGDMLEPIKRS